MDRKSADSLRHTGVAAAPAGNLYLPENFLFANEWLASHSYPPRGDGVGRPSIYSGSKHKNITDGVTVAPFDWGHEGIFLALSASCMKNTFGPTSEKTTLCKVVCFVRVRLLLRHGNPSERQVIWLCRGRLCTRWQPCSVTDFLCVWASTHAEEKQKKKRPVCVLYSSVSLVKLQLGVIYSESGGKLTLRLQRRLKYPALLSHYIVLLHLSTRSHTASYPLWSGERGIKRWQGQGFTSHT